MVLLGSPRMWTRSPQSMDAAMPKKTDKRDQARVLEQEVDEDEEELEKTAAITREEDYKGAEFDSRGLAISFSRSCTNEA
ncbi:hypothetical protein QQP08_019514 [Theobroma cacao]|nr:hypothetical protein QQP08_019514 [Theobroma cacao]